MIDLLEELPTAAMGVLIVAGMTAVSVAAYLLFDRVFRRRLDEASHEVALGVLGVIATINSLLLAFIAVSVWESFDNADEAVSREGNTVGALARDLAVFESAEATAARALLAQYARLVVNEEWAAVRHGNDSPAAWTAFDTMFRAVNKLEPDTPRRTVLLREILARLNDLLVARRDRLYAGKAEVPLLLWQVVIVSTIITIGLVFVLPATRFNIAMTVSLAVTMGLVFYFILAMDRPFAGSLRVTAEPLELAIENIERWDRETSLHPVRP